MMFDSCPSAPERWIPLICRMRQEWGGAKCSERVFTENSVYFFLRNVPSNLVFFLVALELSALWLLA